MSSDEIVRIAREGLLLVIVLSAPILIVSMVVGLIVSLMQAATQVQEQTLTFVPKLVAVVVTLIALGPWIGATLLRFTRLLFEGFPRIVG